MMIYLERGREDAAGLVCKDNVAVPSGSLKEPTAAIGVTFFCTCHRRDALQEGSVPGLRDKEMPRLPDKETKSKEERGLNAEG